ncbi:NAD+ synthase [bacterium]|nr:MAG: NAD+ synthase [bacterium]
MKKIRIALAQINPVVGDLSGNTKKIIQYIKKAREMVSDIVAFPELAITGYPPEDLLLKPHFIKDNINALEKIKSASRNITVIVGFVDSNNALYNAAAVISNNKLVDIYHKKELPNYGVFDEFRYFKPGRRYPVYHIGATTLGINICEDIWEDRGPTRVQALSGAEIIININASPFHVGKASFREGLVIKHALESGVTIAHINMVGGQDELVFDGGSFAVDGEGRILVKGRRFKEELIPLDIAIRSIKRRKKSTVKGLTKRGEKIETVNIPFELKGRKPSIRSLTPVHKEKKAEMSEIEEVYYALLLGTSDYVRKNGFNGVVIGMSGGIDSALVATIAVDALGKKNVRGLFMESPYTSKESCEDTYALTKNLGITTISVPIHDIFKAYKKTLSRHFKRKGTDSTEENIQARIRGNILMAFSNKFGWLVLTTGNKSEMSVGYATLYGDMAGGFAVIKDVPKTMVYDICKWRNEKGRNAVIPERILWKEPSAELKEDQRDTDTLPPYPLLDPILKAYVEDDQSFDEIMKMGCDLKCAQKVVRMVDLSEYKRRQAPPGIKITPRAFGKDRRFPITNKYKSY